MVAGGDAACAVQGGHTREHPIGQVRVQPYPLQAGVVQWTSTLPHRVRHAEPAEIVHERGPTERRDLAVAHAAQTPGFGGEVGDPS